MTLEQAGAIVVIALFAVFVLWGRTAGGQQTVRRIFGSRRDPNPRPTSSSEAKRKGGSRTAPTSKGTGATRKRAATKGKSGRRR